MDSNALGVIQAADDAGDLSRFGVVEGHHGKQFIRIVRIKVVQLVSRRHEPQR